MSHHSSEKFKCYKCGSQLCSVQNACIGLLIISSSSLPVFRRENRLLANKQEVERPFRFFGLFEGEIQCSSGLDLWNLR